MSIWNTSLFLIPHFFRMKVLIINPIKFLFFLFKYLIFFIDSLEMAMYFFSVFLLFKIKVRKRRCFSFISVFWVILSNKWLLLFIEPVHAYKDFNWSMRDFLLIFMFYSPPGSCVQEVFQARILEWISSPVDLPDPGIEPMVPATSPVL